MSEIAPDKPELSPQPLDFPVIGVGASAGGLEAFEALLGAIDTQFQAAFVLVQHLDPTHQSLLPELLSRHTSLPVRQIEDGMPARAGTIHVMPANASLEIHDGTLTLRDFEAQRGFRRPIDDFFQSLAFDQGNNAAAIVLSGTGSDGTVGIRSIKEAGGIALAQDPEDARYDGMPSSAIATGLVDFVLEAQAMPAELERFFGAQMGAVRRDKVERSDFLSRIAEAVERRTGHDFANYKPNTLLRRVQRRMQLRDVLEPDAYLALVEEDGAEAKALFQDLLINVTEFFRDRPVFDAMRDDVIPKLIARARREPVRVWVPGCSSGEEAYSYAMLFLEALSEIEDPDERPDVQIFATDIDEDMLRRARRGIYLQADVADLPEHYLERYFRGVEDGFMVAEKVRDMVRVSSHSLLTDPPFSRIDLVSCRNLLIYFDSHLQERVLPLFHYALRPEGYLLLGPAENLAGRDDLFETLDRERRLYRKIGQPSASFVLPLTGRGQGRRLAPVMPRRRPAEESLVDPRDERVSQVRKRVMERYAPAHVVVDTRGKVVHASGRTGPFLSVAPGEPSTRLLDLAATPLRPVLRSVLNAMKERRRRIVRRGIDLHVDDGLTIALDVVADPINSDETLVVFREIARRLDEDDADAEIDDFATEQRISELEDELSETQANLRSTVEELETSNEELKSSNEEMMSMNEELQSANEELSTVNEELKRKLEELARANADVVNSLNATRLATLFVDGKMKLRSFTSEAATLFRIAESDRGRSLLDLRTPLDTDMLDGAMRDVLAERPVERQAVELPDGRHFIFRALPYLGSPGEVTGVVLTFEDVTELVATRREAEERSREIELLYENSPTGIALLDSEKRYRRINKALASYNGLPVDEHLGRTVAEILPEIGDKLDGPFRAVIERGETLRSWEFEATAPTDPDLVETFELDIYPVPALDPSEKNAAGVIVRRITDFRRMEHDLRHVMGELQHRVKNTLATVFAIVKQTVRTGSDREAMAESLLSRIGALAGTHNLLTVADWRAVALRDILDQELGAHAEGARVTLEGDEVALSSKAALNLSLVLHELTVNALRHGALAADEGKVKVSWSEDAILNGEPAFALEWDESGGPSAAMPAGEPDRADVSEPGPSKDRRPGGFGLRFIERAVRHDLDGTVDLCWKGGRLKVRLVIPQRTLRPTLEGR